MSQCSRREFVAAGAAACFAFLGPIRGTIVLAADAKEKVDVGELSRFKEDGAVDTWAGPHRFFVVRQKDRLFAVSAICTHKGTTLEAQNDQQRLFCPKHKGTFELGGKLIAGKPQASLPRLGIALDASDHVIVDPAQEFAEADWEKPGSFLALPANA